MSDAIPIYQNQNFFAPYFEIKLEGQNLGHDVVRDVLQVSYKDDLENLASFDFTLNDWDPVQRRPKYSSPFDASGKLHKQAGGDHEVPNFEPGAQVELRMGYYGGAAATLMLRGRVASSTVSFPASGNPTVTVRVLDPLADFLKTKKTQAFRQQKPTDMVRELVRDLDGLDDRLLQGSESQAGAEAEIAFTLLDNEYPIIFIKRLARKIGYDTYLVTETEGRDAVNRLYFGPGVTRGESYELEWGKSLISFTPALRTRDLKEEIVLRTWDGARAGNDRVQDGVATWSEMNVRLPDSALQSRIESDIAGSREVLDDRPVENRTEAEEVARGELRKLIHTLLTATGATIGLPTLRAGTLIQVRNVGLRYSHRYRITSSTHKIDSSGYTTEFEARMEVMNA